MKKKDLADLLSAYLILFLLLTVPLSLLAFIINWEDWFFGIKLDGWPAGISLFLKAAIPVMLVWLLAKRTKQQVLLNIIATGFLSFVFILPVFTLQREMRTETGWTIFGIELVLMTAVPLLLLAAYPAAGRQPAGGEEQR